MIKLIATDMDGTLLNKEHKLSTKNKEAIIDIQKKGVKFVLASGRATTAILPFADELELEKYEGYLISYNGGQIINYKTKEILFHEYMDEKFVKLIFEEAKKYNVSFIAYINEIIYVYKRDKYSQVEIDLTGMKYEDIENLDNLDLTKVVKCMLITEDKKAEIINNELQEKYGKEIFVVRSSPIFVEFMNKGIDKGSTLVKLLELLKINKENVIGAGDNYNDITLLENVGVPVAVSNAVEDLKKIAVYISKNNDSDAMEDIIQRYVK